MNGMFQSCTLLTQESLNNILQMCINATSFTGTKTLKYLGLSSTQATTCQSLSNYQAFLNAGWTTGYKKGEINMVEKIKKISKYTVNFLNMINALIIALSPIWGWHLDNITKTIVAITGIISLYLVGGKLFETKEEKNEEIGVG